MISKEKIRVLVVDDMSVSRGLMMQALDSIGIRGVKCEDSALAGLDAILSSPVHLVFSDFNMPDMDGLSFLERVRANPKIEGLGFVLVTARLSQDILNRGSRLRLNNVLKKPFSNAELLTCIESVVGKLG